MVARSQHKTLNTAFREWLTQYAGQAGLAQEQLVTSCMRKKPMSSVLFHDLAGTIALPIAWIRHLAN